MTYARALTHQESNSFVMPYTCAVVIFRKRYVVALEY